MIYRILIILVLISFLLACSSPAYYLQAASGQWKLMHARQDIQSLLDNPATDPELVAQLKSADQISAFAEDMLGLPANGSYTSYVEIDGEAVVWNVVATEEFSLIPKTWCFPVAGCVPYRGYFKQEKATKFAARLGEKGMDVSVSPATAYSTLGWFSDPIFSTMFSGSDTRLAAYLFHELAHQRLYIKGDSAFNEGYASFVEQAGVRAWLELNQQHEALQKWQRLQDAQKDFSGLIKNLRDELTILYSSGETETVMRRRKAEILRSFELAYEETKTEKWHGKRYYAGWFERPVNNARLALYSTYEGSHCAFQELFKLAEGDFRKFHQLAEQKSGLQKDIRERWLTQSCVEVAATDNS